MAEKIYSISLEGKDNLSNTLKSVKNNIEGVSKSTSQLDRISERFNKIENSTAPLKKRLRELQAMIAQMNFDGMTDNDVFVRMTAKAAEMKDALGDASQAVRLMSSDTAKLDATIEAMQGLAGVAGVATGAIGLLGTENEDLQRAMLKVQSAIAVMNGVQQIANVLNKDSILMLKLKDFWSKATAKDIAKQTTATIANNAVTKASTTATNLNTVAEIANTTATKGSTIAQNAWNVAKAIGKAMFGDFTGLLLVGVGALTTYALATSQSTDEQEKQTQSIGKTKDAVKEFATTVAQNCGKQIAQLETLTTQYSSLHTEVEKNDFINKHRKEIEGVVGATDNLRGAWDKIVKNKDKIVNALTEIAIAHGHMANIEKIVTAYIEKRQQMLSGSVHYKKWQNTDIVSASTAKQMGLIEGVDYKKGGMNWQGEKHNLLTPAGVEKANAFEIVKSRKNFQKDLDKLDRDTRAEIQSEINEMTKHQTKGENLLKGTGYNLNGSTPTSTSSTPRYNSYRGNTPSTSTNQTNPVEDVQRKFLTTVKGYQKQLEDEQIDEEEFREKKREAFVNLYNSLVNLYAEGNEGAGVAITDVLNKIRQHDTEDFKAEQKDYQDEVKDLEKSLLDGEISDADFDATMKDILSDYIDNFKWYAEKLGGEAKEFFDGISILAKNFDVKVSVNDIIQKPFENPFPDTLEEDYNFFKKSDAEEYAESLKIFEAQYASYIEKLEKLRQLPQTEATTQAIEELNAKIASVKEKYANVKELQKSLVDENNRVSFINSMTNDYGTFKTQIEGIQNLINALGDSNLTTLTKMADGMGAIGAGAIVAGQAISQLGANSKMAKVGLIASAIGQIIVGYSLAVSDAAKKLGWFGWIAASLSGLGIVASTISQLKGYESGGIIDGTSYHGDKLLARVNSNEMILNQRQQHNLFRMLDTAQPKANGVTGNNVTFTIHGSELVGVIDNYNNKMNW
jgi:hypothetical protein